MSIVKPTTLNGVGLVRVPSAEGRPSPCLLDNPRPVRHRTHPAGVFARRFIASALAVAIATGPVAGLINSRQRASERSSAMAMAVGEPSIGEISLEAAVDADDEEAVDWARERFREAGLSLPPIRLSFHTASDPCEGAQGGHRIEHGVSRVLICISELGFSRELKLKRTLLHEFAHAWDAHFLAGETRAAFMELRDLAAWSFEVPYGERGSEHAAETITWGLMDEPLLFGSLAGPTSWVAQHSGYVTLTGADPPHGYVWSLFAAGHNIYAHTPAQLEAVQSAWDRSEELGRRTERIEVRFHMTSETCGGEEVSSRLIADRLHIQACPTSTNDLAAALLEHLTVEPQRDSDANADQANM